MARVLLRGFKVRSNQKYRLRARKQRNSRNSEQNYKLKETYRPVGRVHKTKARRGGGGGGLHKGLHRRYTLRLQVHANCTLLHRSPAYASKNLSIEF